MSRPGKRRRKRPTARKNGGVRKNVRDMIGRLIDYARAGNPRVSRIVVTVTEPYLRRRLGLRARDRLVYRGFEVVCVAPRGAGARRDAVAE